MIMNTSEKNINETSVRILTLSRSSEEAVTIRIAVSNPAGREEVEFVLLREYCAELSLAIGEIRVDMLPEIEYRATVTKGYFSACASFAYVPSSLKMLYRKLLQKGFAKDAAADAIEAIRNRGFVNESEIACRRAELFVAKNWGPTRIFAKLHEEGFSDGSLTELRVYLSEIDFAANCAALIAKKYGTVPSDPSPESRHMRDRIYASLTRMGYTQAQIREGIRETSEK